MVELEADDALATAAARFAADPAVDAGPRLHAGQGPGPGACAASASSCATGGATSSTTTPASARSGASRRPRSPTGWPWSATPPTGSPGSPASGAVGRVGAPRRVRLPRGRPGGAPGRLAGPRPRRRAARRDAPASAGATPSSSASWPRSASTLPLPEHDAGGAPLERRRPRAAWEAFCARWELPGLLAPAPSLAGRVASTPGRAYAGLAQQLEQARVVRRRGGEDADPLRRRRQVEPRAARHVRHGRPGPLGDEAGRGDVPGREAHRLAVGVEAAVRHVGEGEGRRAHLARDPDRPPDAPRPQGRGAPAHGEAHDEVDEALLARDGDGAPVDGGRPVGGGGERLAAERVVDDAGDRVAVDDQGEGDAEERDPVGVVDGPVDRVADPRPVGRPPRPGPTPRRRSRRPGSARRAPPGSAPRTRGRPRSRCRATPL